MLDLALPNATVEQGTEPVGIPERVAFIASFATTPAISVSLATYIDRLRECGYFVVLVRAMDDPVPLSWPMHRPQDIIVVRKQNLGHDFGSWSVGMALFPRLLGAKFVLLVNDSLIGPFGPLTDMVADFERQDTDVWAATNTLQEQPHLQSYLLGFRYGVLKDWAVRHFWQTLRPIADKQQLIAAYELGLSRLLYVEGFVQAAWIESERVVNGGLNPTTWGWRSLLDFGFPFVKRNLLTDPSPTYRSDKIVPVVNEKFGIDPREWL